MIAITSISPGHKNFENQLKAVESWKATGYEVVSMNAPEEIEILKDSFKDVKFISTHRHNQRLFDKPYVIVSALIDYLKDVKSEYSLIINSDIIIKDNGYTNKLKDLSNNGIVVFNRYDFDGDYQNVRVYNDGFDGFFIQGKFLEALPQTVLCLGQCHWDFWLPYSASVNGVNLIRSKEPYLYHQRHNVQYSKENWVRTAEIFRSEIGMLKYKNVGQVTSLAYRHINQRMA
jgi:hypothetical protein